MRAALYIRVSSAGQVRDGYSLEFQEEILRSFCDREGTAIARVYREEGQTGSTLDREQLRQLVADAEEGLFDVVLIFRVDRFSRDPADLLYLVKRLEENRVRLRSVTESVDAGDPAGELMLTILGAIGKFVRRNIIENSMLGQRKRAQAGKHPGGKVPWGYAVGEDGRYVPDQSPWHGGLTKAEGVGYVFRLYLQLAAEGRGLRSLAEELHRQGAPPPERNWHPATLSFLLRNPAYIGQLAYRKTLQPMRGKTLRRDPSEWVVAVGAHGALVDEVVFAGVQRALERNRTKGGHQPKGAHSLAGFLQCGVCGSALTPRVESKLHQGSKPHLWYTCASRYNPRRRREGTVCRFPYLRAEDIQGVIWPRLAEVASNPALLQLAVQKGRGESGRRSGEEIRRREREITAVEFALAKLLDLYTSDLITREEFVAKRAELADRKVGAETRLKELTEQLTESGGDLSGVEIPALVERTFNLLGREKELGEGERRKILAALVTRGGIRVYPDGRIELGLRIPPPQSPQGPDGKTIGESQV